MPSCWPARTPGTGVHRPRRGHDTRHSLRVLPCLALVVLLGGCPGGGTPVPSENLFPISRQLVDCGDVVEADCALALIAAIAEAAVHPADVRHATLEPSKFPDEIVEQFVMILDLGEGKAVNVAMMRREPSGPIVAGLPEPTLGELPSDEPAICGDRDHAAPDLEAVLPDEIADQSLCRSSFGNFASEQEIAEKLNIGALLVLTLIAAVPPSGVTDLSVAFAWWADLDLTIVVYRIEGADAKAMLEAFVPFAGDTTSTTEIAGRTVIVGSPDPDMPMPEGTGSYHMLATGDMLFVMGGFETADPALAELIAKLP